MVNVAMADVVPPGSALTVPATVTGVYWPSGAVYSIENVHEASNRVTPVHLSSTTVPGKSRVIGPDATRPELATVNIASAVVPSVTLTSTRLPKLGLTTS